MTVTLTSYYDSESTKPFTNADVRFTMIDGFARAPVDRCETEVKGTKRALTARQTAKCLEPEPCSKKQSDSKVHEVTVVLPSARHLVITTRNSAIVEPGGKSWLLSIIKRQICMPPFGDLS